MKIAICLFLFSVLNLPAGAIEVLLPRGDSTTWKYHDGGGLDGDEWRGSEFDDKAWKVGAAPLGYGDAGMSTTVAFGENNREKHVTTYFRHSIKWDGKGEVAKLAVLLRCDDGGVVYLNGKEVARQNMPGGKIGGETLAAFAIAGEAETAFNRFMIPVEEHLKPGENLIAVEVHQASRSSSDLGFDLELKLYAKGEEPKVDHYAEGMKAFRRSDIAAGERHFAQIPADDPNFKRALFILVESVYGPEALDEPEKAVEFAAKAYKAMPGDLEVVRAYVRSHVLAEKNLTYPLKKRPAPTETPQEFKFLQAEISIRYDRSRLLSPEKITADLDYLELMIDNCYSYAERRGVDWKHALDVLRASLDGEKGTTVNGLAFKLDRFLTLFGDPHTSLRMAPSLWLRGGAAPFIAVRNGERILLIDSKRSDFLDADHPYLKAIDGEPVTDWLAAAGHHVPRASPQYQTRAQASGLSGIASLRDELGLPASEKVKLTLQDADGKKEAELELRLTNRAPQSRSWPVGESQLMKDVGYLRIPSMSSDPGFIDSLNEWMSKFKSDSVGLIIDVRGNGGGSQDCLKTLLPYFMEPDAPLRVVNVAAYRLPIELPEPNPSGFLGLYGRGLHPVSSDVWKTDEKESISKFLATFNLKWKLPEKKFSDWHAMGIRPSTNPKAYHYQKPVIVLSDAGCFSATDNFLGGFKGLPGVTLMGTASGGGSGRMQSYSLPNSGIPLTLCQMASYQRNGHTYDGHGVEPDVEIFATPEDALRNHGDSVLEAALERLR